MCPICSRALPPLGDYRAEMAREIHIASCIGQHMAPSVTTTPHRHTLAHPPAATQMAPRAAQPANQPQHTRQPSRPMAYLTHHATEKDCIAEDGSERECSICLVEFGVGDELAVLECLCKFHKVCIRAWLDKSGSGCPLHKILDLEAGSGGAGSAPGSTNAGG
jgi:hypothetical protein